MKKIFYFAAIAALVLVSCKSDEPKINNPEEKTDTFTLKASIEDLATKGNAGGNSDVAKATINGSYGLVWTSGDKIGVYVNEQSWTDKNQPFTLSSGEGTTEGEFTWDYGSFSANATAAFFPWQDAGSSYNNVYNGTMYFKLANWYDDYTTGKMLTPLVASISDAENISFKHAGAAVMLTINNLVSGEYRAKMSVTDKQITGDFHINLANAGSAAITPDEDENTSKNHITLNTWKGNSDAFTWLFPVPALTKPKLQFEIKDGNGILVWSANLKAQTSDLGRADVLVMPAKDVNPYSQFTVSSDWTFCGTINGVNGWASDLPMYTDGNVCILKGINFKSGDEFKIRRNKSWDIEVYPSNNYNVPEAGAKDVFFYPSTGNIELKTARYAYPSPKVTLYFGINTAGGSGIALSSSTLAPGEGWPGLTLEDSEEIGGKLYYKHEVDGGVVWGKSISGVHIVGIGQWNTSSSTLNFNTIKTEYYFEASSNAEITQLSGRPE